MDCGKYWLDLINNQKVNIKLKIKDSKCSF